MLYKVVLQKSDEGYSISCPVLPGCWSQGETEEDALENIKDAIEGYLFVQAKYSAVENGGSIKPRA